MPPLPFSSSGGVGGRRFGRRRRGFRRGRRFGRTSGGGLGGRAGRRLGGRARFVGIVVTRRGRGPPLSPLPAITTTAIDQADDHRDQAGDEQAHVAVRAASIVGLAHHPGRVLVHRPTPPVRVSRRGSRWCPRSRSRCAAARSISARLLPETAIWVASRRAPAELERGPGRRSAPASRLDRPQVRLAARRGPSWRIELVGEGPQALGDDPVGAGAGLLELAAGLLLGVVDHLRGGLLGGLDDRRQALGRAAGQRARLRWSLSRTHRRVA